MQLIIHRGTREIGGNCIELRAGNSRIVLDVGMPLFREDRQPHDSNALRRASKEELLESGILPRIAGLFTEGPPVDAILLSHAHEDHTGLLKHSEPSIPIYASQGTSKMMLAGAKFAGQPHLPRHRHRELVNETTTKIGDFMVTPYAVDHSIYGCQAFLTEAEGKTVLYSGDLRMHGRKPGMHRRLIEALSGRAIDVLLMEGTHIGHTGHRGSTEFELEDQLTEQIKTAPSLVLASFSPQHVDRLVGFLRATKKGGRTFVADVYTAFIMHLIASEIPVPKPESTDWVKVYFPKLFEAGVKRKRLEGFQTQMTPARIELDEIRRNPTKYMMIFRPSMLESDYGNDLPEGSRCLYSRWEGYLNQPDWTPVKELLTAGGGDLQEVHTSGHIYADDIVEFVRSVNAKSVIPIHTFETQAFHDQIANALQVVDGSPITL